MISLQHVMFKINVKTGIIVRNMKIFESLSEKRHPAVSYEDTARYFDCGDKNKTLS